MKQRTPLSSLSEAARRHPVWSGAVALFILAVIVLLTRSGGAATAETAYYQVKRGTFTVSVVEGGNLEAVSEVSIRNEVEGTARVIYIVPEGSYVQKGDLLVELDSMQAQDQYNQQQINFEKARFALIQAEKQLEIQKSEVESMNRAADLKVEFAQLILDRYLKGEALVDMLTASNNISKTEQSLAIDRETLRWSEQLVEKGYETRNVLDRDRLTVTNSELTLQIQQMQLRLIEDYDYPKQRRQYESDLEEAIKERERTALQGANRIAQYEADLLTQSNTLALNESKLERDQGNLEATKRYAPQAGLVVYPVQEGRFSSESMIEEGATVRNRQELIKLPDTSRMKVTIKVHESHVNMVEAGQPAFVVLDSMPDQRFNAYVEKVAPLPDTQSRFGNPNLKVYNTEVIITDALPDIKPGVSARAEIIITNIQDALSVPIQAVTTLKGKQVVYVKSGSDNQSKPVEVGLFNTRLIQIVSGLEDGERVLLSPPFEEHDLEGGILEGEEATAITNTAPASVLARRDRETQARAENAGGRMSNGGGADGAAGADPGFGGPGMGGGASFGGQGDGAEGPRDRGGFGGQGPGGMDPEQMRAQFETLRKEFDKDGDGELNEEERATMREEMQKRFGGMMGGGGRGRQGGQRGQGGDRTGRGGGSGEAPQP